MSIWSGISSAASTAGRAIGSGIGRAFSAIASGAATTGRYLGNLALDGVYDAGLISMQLQESSGQKVSRSREPLKILINIMLSPITYIPGFILGMTVFPLAYYTFVNFVSFFNYTDYLVERYAELPKHRKKPKSFDYNGGSLKVFGLVGLVLGIAVGTVWTTLKTFIMIIIPNTLDRFVEWCNLGYKLANANENDFTDKFDQLVTSDPNFSNLVKFLAYIPFGIFLSAFGFIFSFSLFTTFRIIDNSFTSMWHNLTFLVKNAITLGLTDKDLESFNSVFPPEQKYKWDNFLGLPGLIVGVVTGISVGGFILAIGVIHRSYRNFKKWFAKGYAVPVRGDETLQQESTTKFSNLSLREHLLGMPGHILAPAAVTAGFLFGASFRIALESWRSTKSTYHFLTAKMVYNSDPRIESRTWAGHIIGTLGYPVGLIIIAPFTTLYANYVGGKLALKSILSPFFGADPDASRKDRPIWVKALSAPGTILGGTIGVVARVAVESSRKAYRTGQYWVKLSLTDSDFAESRYLQASEDKNARNKYWGFLGYIVGGVFIAPVFAMIVVARLAWTNADSAKREFFKQVNPKLSESGQIKIAADERSSRLQTAGRFGHFLGFIAGKFGIISIESAVYFEYSFKYFVKKSLYQSPLHEKVELNQTDADAHSKFVGILGILSGGLVGFITGSVLITGRIIFNTGVSIKNITVDMARFVVSGEKFSDINNSTMLARFKGGKPTGNAPQDTGEATPFYLGILGIPLGGLFGTLAALTVGSLRIIYQTLLTTYNQALFYTRYSLPFGDKYNIYPDFALEQSEVDETLGVLGNLSGLPLGMVGFAIGGTIRLVVNTFASISYAFFIGLSSPPVNYNYVKKVNDSRDGVELILGIPGYIIGLPVALIAYLGHISMRVVYDSLLTGYEDARSMFEWSKGDISKGLLFGKDNLALKGLYIENRTPGERHGFGLPGHLAGVAVGTVFSGIVLSIRYVEHQWGSLKIGFVKFADVSGCNDKNKYFKEQKYLNHVNAVQLPFGMGVTEIRAENLQRIKYIVGIPGLIVGASLSAIFVVLPKYAIEYAEKFAKNNRDSFLYLSGSLLNLGGEAFYYPGISGDKRSTLNKVCGAPGYLLAICTAGLVPLANLLFKLAMFVIVSIPTALPVALWKSYKMYTAPRFKNAEGNQAHSDKMKRLKQLYSALDNGEFSEEMSLNENATGGKGSWDFVRKIFCLNEKTYVEKLLDLELDRINNKKSISQLQVELSAIKVERHSNVTIFKGSVRESHNKKMDEEFDKTAGFIKHYLTKGTVVSSYFSNNDSTSYNPYNFFFNGCENLSPKRKGESGLLFSSLSH